MKLDKWTQQLHDKLAEHEVAPPDDLWADIEAALPTPRKSRFVALRRWAAAAAVAALMIGGGYMLWDASPNSSDSEMSEAVQSFPSLPLGPKGRFACKEGEGLGSVIF